MPVPHDVVAEEAVAGVAAASRLGAYLAVEHGVTVDNFYQPALARVFAAAIAESADWDDRLAPIAAGAGVRLVEVARLVDDRPVMFDRAGVFAGRVVDAARRRHVMRVCADVYNGLADGGRLEDYIGGLVAA